MKDSLLKWPLYIHPQVSKGILIRPLWPLVLLMHSGTAGCVRPTKASAK